MKNFALYLAPIVALSLAACGGSNSSSSSSGGGSGTNASHNIVIGGDTTGGPSLKGSGKLITDERKVEQFHAIELDDMAKVQITVGSSLNVSVLVDDNLAKVIDTKVVDGKLIISANQDFRADRAPTITIGVPELSEVYLPSSGEILVNAVKGDVFKVDLSGSGTVFGAGKATNVKVSVSGSGNADCSKVSGDNVTADVSGSGNCKVEAVKSLSAKVSGSGSIKYLGNPASLNKDVTGTGTITAM